VFVSVFQKSDCQTFFLHEMFQPEKLLAETLNIIKTSQEQQEDYTGTLKPYCSVCAVCHLTTTSQGSPADLSCVLTEGQR
jgi:hypothetical protein